MTNILRAKKSAVSERLQKHARLNQTGDGLKSKAANRLDLFVHLAQLRNAIGSERQPLHTRQVLRTRVGLMRRLERLPDGAPNLVLLRRIRRLRNWLPRLIAERKLRDAVASRAILRVAKARMIGAELHNSISIRGSFIRV